MYFINKITKFAVSCKLFLKFFKNKMLLSQTNKADFPED